MSDRASTSTPSPDGQSGRRYLEFREVPGTACTRRWAVCGARDPDMRLAIVKWWGAWRKYVLLIPVTPNRETIFDAGCLREVTAFLDEQNSAHRTQIAERHAGPTGPEAKDEPDSARNKE